MKIAPVSALGLTLTLAFACTTYDSSLLVDAPAGGNAGSAGEHAGAAGKGLAGAGAGGAAAGSTAAGGAGAGGAGGAGNSSAGASGGSAGAAGASGGAGAGGASGAGASGASGASGGAGAGGDAGTGGASGASGGAGASGEAGAGGGAGAGGDAGAAGVAGAGGGAGAGGSGGAGAGGSGGAGGGGAGGAGGKGCSQPSDCDDANACTTDSCDLGGTCGHAPLVDDTATPGVTPDPADCKQSVCKGGKVTLVPAPGESGDDDNACTTDSCDPSGTAKHTPLTGVIACDPGDSAKICVSGVCKANTCGDGVIAGTEACDGAQLGGQTCQSLGFTSGTLLCAPMTCKFATIGCLSVGDLVITEVLYDANVGEPAGEWIELYNPTAKTLDLLGLRIARGTGTHIVNKSVTVAPGAYVVLGSSTDTMDNGGAPVAYGWGNDLSLPNSGGTTKITLTAGSTVVDELSYTPSGTYTGKSYSLMSGLLTAADNDSAANFCKGMTPYGPGGLGTPGAANDCP
ncbi:MAG: lamin tail domain-containing protein [Polyangiaceae bacterium]|nr:lamin tail domain-containing protein [Polyangiaceae bacterium]